MIEFLIFCGGAFLGFCIAGLFGVGRDNDLLAENERLKADGDCLSEAFARLSDITMRQFNEKWGARADRDRASDAVGTLQRRLSDIADAVRNQKSGTARKVLKMAEGRDQ